jgi:pyruvate-formate lyase-activating enzyme
MGRTLGYAELAVNFLIDLYCVRSGSRWFRPLMTNFYVTKGCNLRCRYCYPPGDEPSLPVDEAVALLDKIRPHNPALNITGGEPLMYPGISAVLRRARELAFRPLLLSTNGLMLDRVAADLHLLDHVVISLDSLHAETSDVMCGVRNATPRILAAVRRAAELSREHGFLLSLHTVVAPETIDGIEDILALCEELGAQLSLSPEHGRFDPHPDLPGNRTYVALLNRLLSAKAQERPVFCSASYLRGVAARGARWAGVPAMPADDAPARVPPRVSESLRPHAAGGGVDLRSGLRAPLFPRLLRRGGAVPAASPRRPRESPATTAPREQTARRCRLRTLGDCGNGVSVRSNDGASAGARASPPADVMAGVTEKGRRLRRPHGGQRVASSRYGRASSVRKAVCGSGRLAVRAWTGR